MLTPREYQRLAIDRAIAGNMLVNDDRGLGKTLVAIEAAKRVYAGLGAPILIVAPKRVRDQWAPVIEAQCADLDFVIFTLDTKTALPPKPFARGRMIWVLTHYEALVKHKANLARTFYSTIIADEAHRLRNRTAQRSAAIKLLQAYRKIALTGTSFDRDPADVWSLLNWLEPERYAEGRGRRTYWQFRATHTIEEPIYKAGVRQPYTRAAGVCDPEALAAELAPYCIARKKRDVAPELPPKIIQTVRLELDAAQRAAYTQIQDADDLLVELAGASDDLIIKNVLGKILRLQQLTTDPRLLGLDYDGVKIDWLREFAEDAPDSYLILTRYRDTAERIGNMLAIPVVVGGSKIDTRQLKNEPRIVGTIAAMGEGLDLGHIWTTVFIDVEYSSILMAQAQDRTERDLAAERGRHIIYLQAVGTQDARLRSIAEAKLSIADAVQRYLAGVVEPEAVEG